MDTDPVRSEVTYTSPFIPEVLAVFGIWLVCRPEPLLVTEIRGRLYARKDSCECVHTEDEGRTQVGG